MNRSDHDLREWLETDGLGGYASMCVSGPRRRRYHALLIAAQSPPTNRYALVHGFDASIEIDGTAHWLTQQLYRPGVLAPQNAVVPDSFDPQPWPTWRYSLPGGHTLTFEIAMTRGAPRTLLRWTFGGGADVVRLHVRPFLSGRDYHAMHHCNDSFRFDAESEGSQRTWHPYENSVGITIDSNGDFLQDPQWYHGFLYEEERERGQDHVEDLASPGVYDFDLVAAPALMTLEAAFESDQTSVTTEKSAKSKKSARNSESCEQRVAHFFTAEHARRSAMSPLHRAADDYIVQRGDGETIIAGYPWFTDWGRDTFIALRGLCLSRPDRMDVARRILVQWAGCVSQGMLPNRFPDRGDTPDYNSVDAALWYVIAAWEYMQATRESTSADHRDAHRVISNAILQIVRGYREGTRFGIRADRDGLLAAGEPGSQLTWMDAHCNNVTFTPRIGKPVEIQALWINALRIASTLDHGLAELTGEAITSFKIRFWNAEHGCLHDVVDEDHQRGKNNSKVRSNQILAVGGLPFAIMTGDQAASIVRVVDQVLVTPLGLRSLSPNDPDYRGCYHGGPFERDSAYHQGTVWPWPIGAFVDAWLHVHGDSPDVRRMARTRFLAPLLKHLAESGIGHVSEIADGDPPHTPRGCPFQAWSVGEFIRIQCRLGAKESDCDASETEIDVAGLDADRDRTALRLRQSQRAST